jgi:methylphosphotriester-DNA--protein-cysteine methyltransferase
MSYDYPTLASQVKARLQANPQTTLVSLSDELQVDRHTLERALDACFGLSFRELKNQFKDEVIRAALTDGRPKSIKQAAIETGFGSSAALAKRTRRTMGAPPTKVRRRGQP